MARKSNPKTQSASRVVKVRVDSSPTADGLWPIPPSIKPAGLELLQSENGDVYLTRSSKDGFVQAYKLLGATGQHLKVPAKHRP